MKQLLYILIFLPSLLFSQETKNMELVGVRNIRVNVPQYNDNAYSNSLEFQVDSNKILKIISASFGGSQNGTLNSPWGWSNHDMRASLDGGLIFDDGVSNNSLVNFPFYLETGNHSLTYWANTSMSSYHIILYGLEFKLTTP